MANGELAIGERIYFGGDIANLSRTGEVVGIETNRWGATAVIDWDVEEGGSPTSSRLSVLSLLADLEDESPYARYRYAKPGERRELPAEPYEPDLTNCD